MEKILAFQVKEADLGKLRRMAGGMRIRLQTVEKADFRQPIENLLGQKKNPFLEAYEGNLVTESMLVLDGFSDKRLDALLKALKKEQITVDYKAVVTSVNRKWTALQLYLEMEKEKKAYLRAGLPARRETEGNL